MGARIRPAQIEKFYRHRREGYSIKASAEKAGFSESSAKGILRTGKADHSTPGSRPERFAGEHDDSIGPPKTEDQLSPEAKRALTDFGYFRSRYFGRRSTPWQEIAANQLVEKLESEEEEYVVVNCPPGGGKTTIFSHDFPAWLTVRDRTMRGLLGSHGKIISEGLVGNLRDSLGRRNPVQARLYDKQRGWAFDAETTLSKDFGALRPQAGELWRRSMFTVAQHGETPTAEKESTWVAFSYEAKFLGWRVNFINWDDLVTPAMLRNQDAVDALYEWYDDEAETRLEPGGLLVLVGQRLRVNDVYRYALDKRLTFELGGDDEDFDDPTGGIQKYTQIIYKAHYEEKCEGDHGRKAQPWPDGCLLDPVRIGWQRLRGAQEGGNYNTVWQQEDTDPTKALVRKVWVHGGRDIDGVDYLGCWDNDRAIGQLPEVIPPGSYTVRYMTVDPSPTKFWSVQDWLYVLPPAATDNMTGYRYLINVKKGKMGANEFLQPTEDGQGLEGLAEDWVQWSKEQGHPITYLIMERNAAQRWAMQYRFFQDWANTRNVSVIEHDTTRNKADPKLGIYATLPSAYKFGRIRLPGDRPTQSRLAVLPLVQEVTLYPDSTTDDAVMAQWFGEYHLQDIVGSNTKIGTMYPDMPSWMSGSKAGRRSPLFRQPAGV